MNLPDTIKHKDKFIESAPHSFDGVFDWSWTQGCFGETKITPMDFDGVIERKGNFIIFETKDVGKEVPKGQLITLERIYALGVFTVFFVQGKLAPEYAMAWCANGFRGGHKMDKYKPITTHRAKVFVSRWYEFADQNYQIRKAD